MSIKLKGNLIILIAGGTGGHMYPAIAILEEIKKTSSIYFITDKRGYDYLTNNKTLIKKLLCLPLLRSTEIANNYGYWDQRLQLQKMALY